MKATQQLTGVHKYLSINGVVVDDCRVIIHTPDIPISIAVVTFSVCPVGIIIVELPHKEPRFKPAQVISYAPAIVAFHAVAAIHRVQSITRGVVIVYVNVPNRFRLYQCICAAVIPSVIADVIFSVEPVVVIVQDVYVKVPVLNQTFHETVILPARDKFDDIYAVVRHVLCRVHPANTMAVPVMIPVAFVFNPLQVTTLVARVSVNHDAIDSIPSSVVVAVIFSVHVPMKLILFRCIFAVGVLMIHVAHTFTVDPVVVIVHDIQVIVQVLHQTFQTIFIFQFRLIAEDT